MLCFKIWNEQVKKSVYLSSILLTKRVFASNFIEIFLSKKSSRNVLLTPRSGLGNVRPAGHIRPAKHLIVARELRLKSYIDY
jgi:hypothetical protein